jgi:ribosomal protein L11 methyltransferase
MSDKYIELRVEGFANKAEEDFLIYQLSEQGFESFVNDKEALLAYIQQQQFDAETIKTLFSNEFSNLRFLKFEIENQNWNAEWESQFEPVYIADECIIKAPFHILNKKVKYEIEIMPKMSFGTGHHPTTQMMCEWILENEMDSKQILDMGCGTGVLGILAGLKGAKSITAIDIEENAAENARENFQKNNVNAQVICGTADDIPSNETYDILFANINRNIIQNDLKKYVSHLNPKGVMYLSGFLENDRDAIVSSAQEFQLLQIGFKQINEWISIGFVKQF